jgi:uncharacterized RDD family membrane protein YckC
METVDTVRTVETPEGVELHLRPAGPVARACALFLDQAVVWVGLGIAGIGFAFLGTVGLGLWLILFFFAQWLYPVFFEVLGSGRTLGKRVLKLRVLMSDGRPVSWGPSLLRNLLRVVDSLPFAYTVGLVSVLFSRNFQRLGDIVADTLVIHDPTPHRHLPLADVPPVLLPMALTLEEQSSLLAFGERCPTLTPARAQELGDLLSGLTSAHGEEGVLALQGMALTVRGVAP